MPGQRGTEKRLMAAQVLVRLPSATAHVVTARADAAGLTTAAWIRMHLVDFLGTELADAVPVRARSAPNAPPTVDVVALARLREVVGEANGTLRQVAGLDRARGGARLAELNEGIERLLAAAAELDAAKDAALRPCLDSGP